MYRMQAGLWSIFIISDLFERPYLIIGDSDDGPGHSKKAGWASHEKQAIPQSSSKFPLCFISYSVFDNKL